MARCPTCDKKSWACLCPPPRKPDYWMRGGVVHQFLSGAFVPVFSPADLPFTKTCPTPQHITIPEQWNPTQENDHADRSDHLPAPADPAPLPGLPGDL